MNRSELIGGQTDELELCELFRLNIEAQQFLDRFGLNFFQSG